MKIVHALAYYGDYLGGIQTYVQELSKRQKQEGHKVKIITSDLHGTQNKKEGIPIVRAKALFSAFRVPCTPSMPLKLLKEECDVLHLHLPLPGLDLSGILKKRIHTKTKLIVTIHNYVPAKSICAKFLAWIHNKILMKLILKYADRVIVTNSGFANSLPFKIPEEKKEVISLGIDIKKFNKIPGKIKDQILFVGRMIPEKGLHNLIEAMKSIKSKTKLVAICSDTYALSEYETQMKKKGEGFLNILKNIPNEKLNKYYSQSLCLVFPSIDLDSFGFVLLEAMACNCPVICSDLPGPSSIINKKVGEVFPKHDTKKLRNLIDQMVVSNKKYRKHARNYVVKNFSWNVIYPKIMGVYKK